jgi:hypothetical protein
MLLRQRLQWEQAGGSLSTGTRLQSFSSVAAAAAAGVESQVLLRT